MKFLINWKCTKELSDNSSFVLSAEIETLVLYLADRRTILTDVARATHCRNRNSKIYHPNGFSLSIDANADYFKMKHSAAYPVAGNNWITFRYIHRAIYVVLLRCTFADRNTEMRWVFCFFVPLLSNYSFVTLTNSSSSFLSSANTETPPERRNYSSHSSEIGSTFLDCKSSPLRACLVVCKLIVPYVKFFSNFSPV